MAPSAGIAARRVEFSLSGPPGAAFVVDGDWIVRRTRARVERLVPTAAIALTGRHMQHNVMAAAATTWLAGVGPQAMADRTARLHRSRARDGAGRAHRRCALREPLESDECRGRPDDALKASTAVWWLLSVDGSRAGICASCASRWPWRGRAVVAIGEAAPLVREALADVVPVTGAASMAEAVERAYAAAAPDGVVLLAPACASFDWFRDYAERGRAFKEAVTRGCASCAGRR